MNLHANAKTCPNSRELLARRVIDEGWSHARAGKAAGISERTVAKWVARYRAGEPMADRSSAPRQVPSRTPKQTIDAIEGLFGSGAFSGGEAKLRRAEELLAGVDVETLFERSAGKA